MMKKECCGISYSEETDFCSECGTSLNDNANIQPIESIQPAAVKTNKGIIIKIAISLTAVLAVVLVAGFFIMPMFRDSLLGKWYLMDSGGVTTSYIHLKSNGTFTTDSFETEFKYTVTKMNSKQTLKLIYTGYGTLEGDYKIEKGILTFTVEGESVQYKKG